MLALYLGELVMEAGVEERAAVGGRAAVPEVGERAHALLLHARARAVRAQRAQRRNDTALGDEELSRAANLQ